MGQGQAGSHRVDWPFNDLLLVYCLVQLHHGRPLGSRPTFQIKTFHGPVATRELWHYVLITTLVTTVSMIGSSPTAIQAALRPPSPEVVLCHLLVTQSAQSRKHPVSLFFMQDSPIHAMGLYETLRSQWRTRQVVGAGLRLVGPGCKGDQMTWVPQSNIQNLSARL